MLDPILAPATALGLAGAALVPADSPTHQALGYLVWIVGNFLWVVHGIAVENPYIFVLFGLYMGLSVRGLYKKRSVIAWTPSR